MRKKEEFKIGRLILSMMITLIFIIQQIHLTLSSGFIGFLQGMFLTIEFILGTIFIYYVLKGEW